MERLAIMGGTFDPIHMGHLRMAYAVQRQLDFDRVVFLPAYIPPHKQTRSDADRKRKRHHNRVLHGSQAWQRFQSRHEGEASRDA